MVTWSSGDIVSAKIRQKIREPGVGDPSAAPGPSSGYRDGEVGEGDAGAVEPEVVSCLGRTRSNMVRAESTQARIDSRSSQMTRSCVSPLRRKKRAPVPPRSSSSSRMERPRQSSERRSSECRRHSLRISRQSPRSSSSRSRDDWLHADVAARVSPAASKSAFRM